MEDGSERRSHLVRSNDGDAYSPVRARRSLEDGLALQVAPTRLFQASRIEPWSATRAECSRGLVGSNGPERSTEMGLFERRLIPGWGCRNAEPSKASAPPRMRSTAPGTDRNLAPCSGAILARGCARRPRRCRSPIE